MSPETLPVFRDIAKVKKKNLNCFFFYLFWLQRRCFKIYTVALSMQETCPNHSSEREVTGENGRRQASVDDCRQICTCRHYPCLHAQSSPPFFPVIPIRKVLPLKRCRRMSCRTHNFNVRDRSSGESIHFLFLHLCLFDAVLCLLSSQAIYCKERGRQHDWCLPTTQYVTGLRTSAGKAGPILPLSYTAMR